MGLTLVADQLSAEAVFFAGTVVAGAGFGAGFQGVVRTVLPHAPADQRSGVLSLIWVGSYLALGLPAVGAGVLVVHGGIPVTAREYGSAVMLLAALALAGLARGRRSGPASPAPVPTPSPAPDYFQILERCG